MTAKPTSTSDNNVLFTTPNIMVKKWKEKTTGQKIGNVKLCGDYPGEKLRAIDLFCKAQGMSRAMFISKLFDKFMEENKEYFSWINKL